MLEIVCRTGDACLDEAVSALVRRAAEGFLPLFPKPFPYRRLIVASSPGHGEEGELYLVLSRPFSIRETEGEVRRLFQNALRSMEERTTVGGASRSDGDIRLMFDGSTVRLGQRAVTLSAKEAAVFRVLYDGWGSPVSREALTEAVWGRGVSTNVCDVTVCHLRAHLEPLLGKGAVVNIRGEGYLLLQT